MRHHSAMRIDRERFLFVAAALATGATLTPACGSSQTPPPEEPRAAAPEGQRPPPAQSVVIPPAPPASAAPPVVIAPPPAPEAPPPTAPPSTASGRDIFGERPQPAQAGAGKPPNPYDGTPVTAQSCSPSLNATGPIPKCAIKAPPGPTCESIGDTKSECPTLATLFKPRVAAAAIECLNKRSGTKDICEFNVSSICAYEALGSACKDPAVTPLCDKVLARCGTGKGRYNKMSRESCEAGVSGVADSKRARFVACITESCRFETCLTYM